MSTVKNPLENIEVRVMAAGGVDYLPEDTALHCKKVDLSCGSFGKKIAEMYQESILKCLKLLIELNMFLKHKRMHCLIHFKKSYNKNDPDGYGVVSLGTQRQVRRDLL